jgi:hypothetical protein
MHTDINLFKTIYGTKWMVLALEPVLSSDFTNEKSSSSYTWQSSVAPYLADRKTE